MDESLESHTQGRARAMTHAVVPQYLRTKLIPEMEAADAARDDAAATAGLAREPETAYAQIQTLNRTCKDILNAIDATRGSRQRPMLHPSSATEDIIGHKGTGLDAHAPPPDCQALTAALYRGGY